MANKYNSLDELRRKKKLLQSEVDHLESLLTFDNAKESLSVLTGGFSDSFLKEVVNEDGETSISLKTKEIVDSVADGVKNTFTKKDTLLDFAKSELGSSLAENAVKLAIVGFVGNYAKKSLEDTSVKKKLIGLVLIYLAPSILRFIRKKLQEFHKNARISSMEQLI
ncbi:phosphoribosyl-ATP pyrophosphatase [Halpernia sp. GG3]